jgi:nitrogen fixation protein NifU and related proteins
VRLAPGGTPVKVATRSGLSRLTVDVPFDCGTWRYRILSDLRELYQEVILDHSRKPRNFRKIEDADRMSVGYNPLCGDRLTLFLDLEDGVVKDASFQGVGCAISTASASMMTEAVKGKRVEDAEKLFEQFHEMVTASPDEEIDASGLGKLQVFGGVREFPARVKCASLAWHTVHAALHGQEETSTE